MPEKFNNIFLTTENLAFSLPLILTVAIYLYFSFLPLPYAILGIVSAYVIYQVQIQIKAHNDQKLTNMDESTTKHLISQLENDAEDESYNSSKESDARRKAKNRVEMRLAQERKAAARKAAQNKGNQSADADDIDTDTLKKFVKSKKV